MLLYTTAIWVHPENGVGGSYTSNDGRYVVSTGADGSPKPVCSNTLTPFVPTETPTPAPFTPMSAILVGDMAYRCPPLPNIPEFVSGVSFLVAVGLAQKAMVKVFGIGRAH